MQSRLLAFPGGCRGAGHMQFYVACSTDFHLDRRAGDGGQSFPEGRAIWVSDPWGISRGLS